MSVRAELQQLVRQSISDVARELNLNALSELDPELERTRDPQHGDFATSIALRAAKPLGIAPRTLAEHIVQSMPASAMLDRVEIAGPGFINFTLSAGAYQREVLRVVREGAEYGKSTSGAGQRVLLEYVSANPTGPLHVGHGRHAAFGASLANILRATGHEVDEEYYVNDAGRQMDILAVSVWLRYLEICGIEIEFPSNCYQGDYCRTIAESILEREGDTWIRDVTREFPADPGANAETMIDALIDTAKHALGPHGFGVFFEAAINDILADIRNDLAEFGVHYQRWYSEQSLTTTGAIDRALKALEERGLLYVNEGATWFRSTEFGDDKDRVVIRENGATTYFASDIAYHKEKCERGYDLLLNVLGADHHGYVARLKAALAGLGERVEALEVRLVQFVILFRGSEKVQMTTRGGTYVTLRDLRNEVGNDAARFFYVSRSNDQHLDFDLDLAKSQSNDNPVYYVQYAHARIASMLRKLGEDGFEMPAASGDATAPLDGPAEKQLMLAIGRYPDVLLMASTHRAPQALVQYLRELAAEFHSFYNAERIIVEDQTLRDARLLLVRAVQQVIENGLTILGVSAPTAM
jgi:arginyl-tRNA synthetase